MNSIITIAQASFKEAFRKKIFHLIGFLTLVYLLVFSFFIMYIGGNMKEASVNSYTLFANISSVVAVLGFYFSSMVVAFLTIMMSIGLISSEIESSTIYAVLTKPISRTGYIMGKLLGTAILITLYSIFLYSSICLIPMLVKISFLKVFGIEKLLMGLLYFTLEPLALLCLCIRGSVSHKTISNGILIISIYILGIIGSVIEQVALLLNNNYLSTYGILFSFVSPFDSIYRKMIATIFSSSGIFNSVNIPGIFTGSAAVPSVWMMIYVILYMSMCIIMAARKFSRTDI